MVAKAKVTAVEVGSFVSVDVETANHDKASICAVGLCTFSKGKLIEATKFFVDPGVPFDPLFVRIHGITPDAVSGAPGIVDVLPRLAQHCRGRTVAHHTSFDRLALDQAAARLHLPEIDCKWLDTAEVARHTWRELDRGGYALPKLAQRLRLDFKHHDPCEDARAAGSILIAAILESGLSLDEWHALCPQRSRRDRIGGVGRVLGAVLEQARAPSVQNLFLTLAVKGAGQLFSRGSDREVQKAAALAAGVRRGKVGTAGIKGGRLAGEIVVFTGELSIPRSAAAASAAAAGCTVADSVTRKTTILVVGSQDARVIGLEGKSNKQLKAETLIASGVALRILGEGDFLALLKT